MSEVKRNISLRNSTNIFTSTFSLSSNNVPKPLIGESVIKYGDEAFVYGGRDALNAQLVNDMYVVDLNTCSWKQVEYQGNQKPIPRYFHSGDLWNNKLIFFGGMGFNDDTKCLYVLNDIDIYDIETKQWSHIPGMITENQTNDDAKEVNESDVDEKSKHLYPSARYGHLHCVLDHYLIIFCGQDLSNSYIEEINIFDLDSGKWVFKSLFNHHCGIYRSNCVVINKDSEFLQMCRPINTTQDSNEHSIGSLFFYLNYNFVNVKRQVIYLELFELDTAESEKKSAALAKDNNQSFRFLELDVTEKFLSSAMPPGLRFPAVNILGDNLILSGIYLTSSRQAFVLWVYSLDKELWLQLDMLGVLNHGSWFKCLVLDCTNRFVVFGNKTRKLTQDYNLRQSNYDHIVFIELEGYGVYRKPQMGRVTERSEQLGKLLLNGISDMEILTIERMHIPCLSRMLYKRWPAFQKIMDRAVEKNQEAFQAEVSQLGPQLTDLPFSSIHSTGSRVLYMPYSFETCSAFLHYIYCGTLNGSYCTAKNLCNLLILCKGFEGLETFFAYIVHLLHGVLNRNNVKLIYETAALTGAKGLQLRALRRIARIEQGGTAISPTSPLPNLDD